MPANIYNTIVVLPDNSRLEVSCHCIAQKQQVQLVIQLHDCYCTLNIDKAMRSQPAQLEKIVHNKVINTKGHLC